MNKILGNKKAICLFTLPSIILFGALVLLPILWSLTYTFFSGMPGVNFEFSGLANYIQAFSDQRLWSYVKTNLFYTVIVTVTQLSIGLILALMISTLLKKHQNLMRTIIFVPVVLPSVAVGQLFQKIYAVTPQEGLLNAILRILGLGSLAKDWLGSPSSAFWGLSVMEIWKFIGLYCLLFYSGLIELPDDVMEAAKIDGANTLQTIFRVKIPLLKPVFRMSLIFCLTGCFKVYDTIVALTGGGPGTATTMPSLYMYSTAFQYSKFGYGSVIALISLIECFIATAIVTKVFSSKEG